MSDIAYADRLKQELSQFKAIENLQDLHADIATYYARNYRWPRLKQVSGAGNHLEFYATAFAEQVDGSRDADLLSIGSGDSQIEIQIAKRMIQSGATRFVFHCLEYSPEQIARAESRVRAANLESHFHLMQGDFNTWKADRSYAGVMAHFALHHVTEIEHLFDQIHAALADDGVFATMDVVGRNGHKRWPETLEIVERIWNFLPEERKFHRSFKRRMIKYPDPDCSSVGFEGIRAQDIMPNLISRFHFETFVAGGGLVEVFIGPNYGRNFNPDDERDRAFVEFLHYLNDLLIDLGHITPTQIFARMKKQPVSSPAIYRHWTPEFCMRRP